MRKSVPVRGAVILGLLLGFGGPAWAAEQKEAKPEAKQSEAKAEAPDEPRSRPFVRLSYVPGSAALPVLVGIERGFFQREGLTVSAVPVINQRAVTNSLVKGFTDFATGSQSWLLDMAHAKAPVKVVALSGYGKQIEVVVPAWDKKTKTVSDLKGKTVLIVRGTHNFDIVPEFYRILAFSKMRISSVDIGFIDLGELRSVLDPKFKSQYEKRNVGAIVTYREYTRPYTEENRARTVMSNEQITKLIGRISPRPLLANARFVENDPEAVKRFVTAWARTMKYIDEKPEDAARVLSIYYGRQYGSALDPKDAQEIIALTRYNRVAWNSNDTAAANINAKAISAARNLLFKTIKDKDKRPFKTPPEVDSFIDSSFVDAAIKAIESQGATAEPDSKERTSANPGNLKN